MTDNRATRCAGFYWVAKKSGWEAGKSVVARWDGSNWWLAGDECERNDDDLICRSGQLMEPRPADDAPMSLRERQALDELRSWGPCPYTWKPASMRKLDARGLVHPVGKIADAVVWELTEEGKSHE